MTETQKLWEHRISDWEQSGMSQRKYCTQNDISYSTFNYWRRKSSPKIKQFAEVKIKDSIIDNSNITINLPNGIQLSVKQLNNLKGVKELVYELKDLI